MSRIYYDNPRNCKIQKPKKIQAYLKQNFGAIFLAAPEHFQKCFLLNGKYFI